MAGFPNYRYIRLFLKNFAETNYGLRCYSLADIRLYNAAGTQITVAADKVMAYTHNSDGRQPFWAVDGDTGSFWTSELYRKSRISFFRLDLGAPTQVSKVLLRAGDGAINRAPTEFIIQGSNDGVNYTDILAVSKTWFDTAPVDEWQLPYDAGVPDPGGGGPAGNPVLRAATVNTWSGTTMTFPKPDGLAENDLLVMSWVSQFGGRSPPAGWAMHGDGNGWIATKRATSGEVAATSLAIDVGGSNASPIVGILSAWGDVEAVEAKNTTNIGANAGSPLNLPAFSIAGPGRTLVIGAGGLGGSGLLTQSSELTLAAQQEQSGGSDGRYVAAQAYRHYEAAGAAGSNGFTGAMNKQATYLILRGAPA